jgi:hypothetical protein
MQKELEWFSWAQVQEAANAAGMDIIEFIRVEELKFYAGEFYRVVKDDEED